MKINTAPRGQSTPCAFEAQERDAGAPPPAASRGGACEGLEPPTSNTGAQNTEGPESRPDQQSLVDWNQATLPEQVGLHGLLGMLGLGLDQVQELAAGYKGWAHGLAWGNVRVYYGGHGGLVHLLMTGQGCREFEAKAGVEGWGDLFRQIDEAGGHWTRLDLAIDDFTNRLNVPMLKAAPARSRWKSRQTIEEESMTGEYLGQTLYFGSAGSLQRLRVYDKQAEQKVDYPWLRFELQLRDERATTAAQLIAQGYTPAQIVAGDLKGMLSFLEPNPADSNRARWSVAAWWEEWLGQVEKLSLVVVGKAPRTIAQAVAWLERQVGPNLATIRKAYAQAGESFARLLEDVIARGEARMKDRHWAMLAPA